MLALISWLKEYVSIKLPLKDLMWKMTEAGLTCESYKKIDGEIVLDVEVTPNRPDWLSTLGIAREIGAIQGTKIKPPKILDLLKSRTNLPVTIHNNFELCPRYTAVTLRNVKLGASPDWVQKRLKLIGLRPINNLVDTTNYVMFELGNPIHVFDYDKLKKGEMSLELSKGGESFVSVDEKTYTLPKDAIIFKSGGEIVDLCGIKGGFNSGVTKTTKNILILVAIYNGVRIRRVCQKLALTSDASKIFERGANSGGTLDALKRTVNLIQETGGGKIASGVYDAKKEKFEPWTLELSLTYFAKVLGIKIPDSEVRQILSRLNLSPKLSKSKVVCTIPTYRGDLKIEEDLIEEVARIYGYNKFPKTLPVGKIRTENIPYYFDDSFHLVVKNLLSSCGYSEVMTYSLISRDLILACQLNRKSHIKLSNPVSAEYEYLRASLVPSLLSAIKLNANEKNLQLFELDKVYLDIQEPYKIAGISKGQSFRDFKGMLDLLFERIRLAKATFEQETYSDLWHPSKAGSIWIGKNLVGSFGQIHPNVRHNLEIKDEVLAFEFDVETLSKNTRDLIYKEIPSFPAQIEDLTLLFPPKTRIGEVAKIIEVSPLVRGYDLTGTYKGSYTFRIWYQHPTKTLTDKEVEEVRNKLLKNLEDKFGASLKS